MAREHTFGVEEDLTGKMGFVLANRPYKVRNDQKDDHMEGDVVASHDVKIMAKVLGDVIKLRVHELVFCSALQLSL